MLTLSVLALYGAILALIDQNKTLKEIRSYNEELKGLREDLDRINRAAPTRELPDEY